MHQRLNASLTVVQLPCYRKFIEKFVAFYFQQYNQHLLKCALQSLIGDTCITNGEIGLCENTDATVLNDVLNYAQLLTESKFS